MGAKQVAGEAYKAKAKMNSTSQGAAGDKLKGWWNKAFSNAKQEFGNIFTTGTLAPEGFDYSFRGTKTQPAGLKAFGQNLGRQANVVSGIMQGVNAATGIADYYKSQNSIEDLLSGIRSSALSNPLASSYLTSAEVNLLNKIRNGSYDASSDAGDFLRGMGSGIGDAAMGALMGLSGGLPGVLIGGIGGLINGGIDGLSAGTEDNYAELSALYQSLMDAEAQYRSMKRPNFNGLGIQQQYQNMYA